MASGSIHVKVSGQLQDHIKQQVGDDGLYENASEYIRALIRRDLQTRDEAWEMLQKELAPAMRAEDSEFVAVRPKTSSAATGADKPDGGPSILFARRCRARQALARYGLEAGRGI